MALIFYLQTQVLSINGILNGALPWNYIVVIQNFSQNRFSDIPPEDFQINFKIEMNYFSVGELMSSTV